MKVNHWTHRWLSFAGQVQLIKSVVQALPIYRCMLQVAPMGFLKDLDSMMRQFLWAGCLEAPKWSLVRWEVVCSPKHYGGLGLRQSALTGEALAAKLYWQWCNEQDKSWAIILSQKYLPGIPPLDISRYPPGGKGSVIWDTLKKGAKLIKDGLFWICNNGEEAQFWSDSWDGYPPIIFQFPNLLGLCQQFQDAGWSRVRDFKSFFPCGQMEMAKWKPPDEWPVVDLQEECAMLQNILSSRRCCSIWESDGLAWSPNPKGIYMVAAGYSKLVAHKMDMLEVQWWKKVWNKLSWPKCNCFIWMLAWNKCLTWDNIRKRGFHGPSICVMCGTNEEDSSHLFFRCSFALQLWHFWWEVWVAPCVHASSLTEFWQRMGCPLSMATFLQEVWFVGPIFLLWQIWLERNRRIFRGERRLVQQIWQRVLGMINETVAAKCVVDFPLGK